MTCWHCGSETPPHGKFCSRCGSPLSADVSTIPGPALLESKVDAAGDDETRTSLQPGDQLQQGRYIIVRPLGHGGMGAALLARDTRIFNKLVVIKELVSTDPQHFQEEVRNFEREVEMLARIKHPFIPSVTDRFQEGAHYYMAQDYIAGENLEEYMHRRGGPLPEREVLEYALQLLDILDYLEHQLPPIVHRDIKPANIILKAEDRHVYLVDFGIARSEIARHTRQHSSVMGTPGYAPPEQYYGNADNRADLYALGATMYCLLTASEPTEYPPFNFPPLAQLNPQLSPSAEYSIMRALEPAIDRRYQSAGEMKRDIEQALSDATDPQSRAVPSLLPHKEPPPTSFHPLPAFPSRRLDRRPWLFLAAGAVAALLILSGGIGLALHSIIANPRAAGSIASSTPAATPVSSVASTSTFTVGTNATASVVAQNQDPYAPKTGTLALYDQLHANSASGWDEGASSDGTGGCHFNGGTYHVFETRSHTQFPCYATLSHFTNFTYRADMTILKGDCGGMVLRGDKLSRHYYVFEVCQNGTFAFYINGAKQYIIEPMSHPAIRTGVGQGNLIAVTANMNSLTLYVNNVVVGSTFDGTYSQGQVGLVASDYEGPTEVQYIGAEVWRL